MAGMKDSGQWLIILGFIVSVSLLMLAIVANNSMLVGQTSAESILDFPKSEILSTQHAIVQHSQLYRDSDYVETINQTYIDKLDSIAMNRINMVVGVDPDPSSITIHMNNGLIAYNSTLLNSTRTYL